MYIILDNSIQLLIGPNSPDLVPRLLVLTYHIICAICVSYSYQAELASRGLSESVGETREQHVVTATPLTRAQHVFANTHWLTTFHEDKQ